MGLEDIGKPRSAISRQELQTQQESEQEQSRYIVPQDHGYSNFNEAMMAAVLESGVTPETNFDNYPVMYAIAVDLLARIPNIDRATHRRLNRDFADIVSLASCQGQRRVVNTRMQKLVFELRSLAACGDVALPGITAVSSIISSRQHVEQTLKATQQPLPERKKIFGVF